MAKHSIELTELVDKIGFAGLDHSVASDIFQEVCDRLEKELVKKRNNKFGWSDSCGIEDESCEPRTEEIAEYVVVIDEKIVRIKPRSGDILLEGHYVACKKLSRLILEYAKHLSKGTILKKVKHKLTPYELDILEEWQLKSKEPKRIRAGRNNSR